MDDRIICAGCGHPIMRDVRSPRRRWRIIGEATSICPRGGLHDPTLRVDWSEFDEVREEWAAS